MVVYSKFVKKLRATAFTVCPIIFVAPGLQDRYREDVVRHEWVHWWQQFWFGVVGAVVGLGAWFMMAWPPQPSWFGIAGIGILEGWVAGQLFWRALYLLVLPVWWNPFRRHWETQAFKEQGMRDDEIEIILSGPPYYLR